MMLSSPKFREVPVHHEVTETLACRVQDLPSRLTRAYDEIVTWAARHHVRVSAPFARYMLFTPIACTVEAGYIADRSIPPAGNRIHVHDNGGYIALTVTHVGPFTAIARAYDELEEFIRLHGYASAGAPIEYYLTPPDTPPEKQKTEIVWPIVSNEA